MDNLGIPLAHDDEGPAISPSKPQGLGCFPASSSGFKTRPLKRRRTNTTRCRNIFRYASDIEGAEKSSKFPRIKYESSSSESSDEAEEDEHKSASEAEEGARGNLAIQKEKKGLIKALQENNVVLIQGESGCGKTTQVPQFLYEAGFTKNKKQIGITQPRRIAAMSMAARVGEELKAPEKVGFHIRHEKSVSQETVIKYMTDGVLLKELKNDLHLTSYSVIIIDEIQERTIFSDLLIGILPKIISTRAKQNDPLKLILMSCSMQIDFMENKELFESPPFVIKVTSVNFRVKIHHTLKTPEDIYVHASCEKVRLINKEKPPGGILIFLPGKKEIDQLIALLMDNSSNPERVGPSLYVLPLYSALPFHEQEKIYKPPPKGSRLCVVATNIAEASITVPGIKYVIDSGRVKTKVYHPSGISKVEILWCSKASANLRAGHCGHAEGGHCYRLYSSSYFDKYFPEYLVPEIERTPVDHMVLRMKALGIDSIVKFPFPSPPEKEILVAAEKRLVRLGALEDLQSSSLQELQKWDSAKITSMGRNMEQFPISPHFSKMLLLAVQSKCVEHVAAIVSVLTGPSIFDPSPTSKGKDIFNEGQLTLSGMRKIGTGKKKSFKALGDAMVNLRAVSLFGQEDCRQNFCKELKLNFNSMVEIQKIYAQLIKGLNRIYRLSLPLKIPIDKPDEEKALAIRRIMASCLIDNVAKKLTKVESKDEERLKNSYQSLKCEEPVFIHPSSILFHELPELVVFNEIVETSKVFMKGVIEIEPDWLHELEPSLCTFYAPLNTTHARYDNEKDEIYWFVDVRFGRWQWEMPRVWKAMPPGALKTKYFCYLFLSGEVFKQMEIFKNQITIDPSIILKSEKNLSNACLLLLEGVESQNVYTKKAMKKVWEKNPKYLLTEVLQLTSVEKHSEMKRIWPLSF